MIRPRTVENHRARVMERIGAKNLAELQRVPTGVNRDSQGAPAERV